VPRPATRVAGREHPRRQALKGRAGRAESRAEELRTNTMIQGIGSNDRFSLGTLQSTQDRLQDTLRHLASGKRVDRAADDAAGLAIATRMLAYEGGVDQGAANLASGVDLANTAEGALDTTQQNLSRMRELSIQAQNGTLNAGDRAAIQNEYDSLAAEIDRTAAATSYGGRPLLDGSAGGSNAVSIADGQGGTEKIDIPDQSAAALGVSGLSVSDPNTTAALDQALDNVSSTRASLGSTVNSLQSRISNLRQTADNTAAARSRIEDVDVAQATAERTRDDILAQAQIALAGHSRGIAATTLRLLA
jgi:flagellin